MYGAQVVPEDKEVIDMREGEKVGRRRIRGEEEERERDGKRGEGKGEEGEDRGGEMRRGEETRRERQISDGPGR